MRGTRFALVLLAAAALTGTGTASAAFPGANGKLAYTSGYDSPHVWTTNADGTGAADLGLAGRFPRFSADGTQLAYVATDGISVARADGTAPRHVTAGTAASWSPDSARLAVVRSGSLYSVPLDGSAETKLADGVTGFPAWSPDGSTILFSRGAPAAAVDLWSVRSTGGGETNLTRFPADGRRALSPSWSPDGRRIAYSVNYSVYTMNADGSGATLLASQNQGTLVAWSPDGTSVAYETQGTRPSLGAGIAVVRLDGTERPSWQPSSQWLASPDWQPQPVTQKSSRRIRKRG